MKNVLRGFYPTLSVSEDDPKPQWAQWFVTATYLAVVVAVAKWVFGSYIPFDYFQFWSMKGSVREWVVGAWPVFAWGAGVTLLFSLLSRNSYEQNKHAERFLARGISVSLCAGIMEEIVFRWLLLMTGILAVRVTDWIFGGCIFGNGLVWWLQTHITLPLANFFSFHMLSQWLQEPGSWYVAAGIIAANVKFRDGHKYQGLLGMVNSWFIGLYFFHLMFKFGLPAAILVHVLYDLFIFIVRYIDRVIERAQSR